jgi:hypothetical protein
MARPVDQPENESVISTLLEAASGGAIRITLLFGSAAIALAVILTPIAETQIARSSSGNLDMMATGATGTALQRPVGGAQTTYTIRRSVLQGPGGLCVVNADGSRVGDC